LPDLNAWAAQFLARPNCTGAMELNILAITGNGDSLIYFVEDGRMKERADFYRRLFDLRAVGYFDIEGKLTGLKGKAMTSPCGKIRIPINESSHDKSQTAETLDLFHGEGILHIALGQRRRLHHRGWHEATGGGVSGHHQSPWRPGRQTPARAWCEPC
jgi:4-hydroxyphenylpyruvate dioxygenase-like putative hemolysin